MDHSHPDSDFGAIPEELRNLRAWVRWKSVKRDGKLTKIPYRADGKGCAKSNNPRTWTSFKDACQSKVGTGIGCVVIDDFVAIDLDHCRDPQSGIVEPWARDIINKFDSFTEVSPSGTGVHIWVHGKVPAGGNRRGNVEMYDAQSARYMTVTGDVLRQEPIRKCDLTELHHQMLAGDRQPQRAKLMVMPKPNGEDASADDFAFCCDLAEKGSCAAEIDEAMRESSLMRPKWDERRGVSTYGERTISKALERRGLPNLSGGENPRAAQVLEQAETEREPIEDGAAILNDVKSFTERFLVLTPSQFIAIALWVAHSYCFQIGLWTPYLNVQSPAKRCGKSRLLEVLSYIVRGPWTTSDASAAALFRSIEKFRPTLLFDEVDLLLKAPTEMAMAIRSVLNSGAHHSGSVARVVGQGAAMETRNFSTYCPKALSGIGSLPDTVRDRSLPIKVQRKLKGQHVERLRERTVRPAAIKLCERLARWIRQQLAVLRDAEPVLPEQLNDRQQDGAEILLAIADAAGSDWPAEARKALVELYGAGEAVDESTQTQLLSDLREIYKQKFVESIFSEDLVSALKTVETSPWAEWNYGRGLSKNGLARLLKDFEIFPRDMHGCDDEGREKHGRGYDRKMFIETWDRYLPAESCPVPLPPEFNRATAQTSMDTGENPFFQPRQENSPRTSKSEFQPINTQGCADARLQTGGVGEKTQKYTKIGANKPNGHGRAGHNNPGGEGNSNE